MKQKLQVKLKNIPTSASLACSSINLSLNKDENLSVRDKVLTCNTLEVNPVPRHTGHQNLRVSGKVYVE